MPPAQCRPNEVYKVLDARLDQGPVKIRSKTWQYAEQKGKFTSKKQVAGQPSHYIESDMFESGRYAECHLLKVGERRST